MKVKSLSVVCSVSGALIIAGLTFAEKKPAVSADRETVAKPMTDKEKKRREAKLRKELETPYRKWLNEDVVYIITDEERQAFHRLQTDEERQNFIEGFWLRRDPTPDTAENEFKEEHYRRIAYSNERFASGIPGWKTDRGRIYIMYGPPAEIESHPSGGSYERPYEEGGGSTSTYPFETWRYRYLDDIGTDITIEFVDPTMTGEYHMTMDPSEKDALLMVPGAGLTMMEQMGLASKNDRFNRTDGTHLGIGNQPMSAKMNEFERLEQFAKLQKPPAAKFKDLEQLVTSTIKFNVLPMKARADYLRMTNSTILTNITLQFDRHDLEFQAKDGVSKSAINLYARITSMSHPVVNVFEDVITMDVATELVGEAAKGQAIYQKSVPLPPGMYRLNVVAKDIFGGSMNNYEMALTVPHFDDEKLASSSVIVADMIERVPTKSIGTGQFVIGTSKVRPRLNSSFRRDEKLGLYLQLYNFTADEKTHKPSGQIDYELTKDGSNTKVMEFSEDVSKIENASATQVTVEKILPLKNLEPGQYTIRMKVMDTNSKQTLTPAAKFTVL